jgi:tetratricopeptide (TPR) repeat protein
MDERAANAVSSDTLVGAAASLITSLTPEHTLSARQFLEEAIRSDPGSSGAWSQLSSILASDYLNRWNNAGAAELGEAEQAAQKALEIDPEYALAHFASGLVSQAKGDHEKALGCFERAIKCDPNFARAYAYKAAALINTGRPESARSLVEKAIQLNPRDPSLGAFYWIIGRAYFYMGEYDEAIRWLQKSIEIRPNLWYNRLYLVSALAIIGEQVAANKALDDFDGLFRASKFTLPTVLSYEQANPNNNSLVVAGRERFHQGLLLAGMADRYVGDHESTQLGAELVKEVSPSFFFSLEGEGARCNEALWGAAFDLVFRYDVPTVDALGVLRARKLEPLLREVNAELTIIALPKGFTLADGESPLRVVRLESGKMVGDPPHFRLQAPEKRANAKQEAYGVYIHLMTSGRVIYQFELKIQLVDKFSIGPRVARVLDLDLGEVATTEVTERRDAYIYIYSDGGPWQVSWRVGDDPPTRPTLSALTASNLTEEYKKSMFLDDLRRIANDSIWKSIDEKLELPLDNEVQNSARACLRTAMEAGAKLDMAFSADPIFRQVLNVVDNLPDGSRIAIYTDKAAFPWELLYPQNPSDVFPPKDVQPERFWGRRFLMESLLFSSPGDERLPAQRQQPGKLHISMGVDSEIDTEWQHRTLHPVKLQREYLESLKDRGDYFDQYDKILDIILQQPHVASLIYFFCHGAADQLKFGKTSPILTAYNASGLSYPHWPIVFINACEAGNISPLSFYSFRTKFRERKAAGLLAPSFPIPTLFAAVFAKKLIERYAERQTIGQALFELRRDLLAKGNPLGLWYSLQCPLDVKAPEQ